MERVKMPRPKAPEHLGLGRRLAAKPDPWAVMLAILAWLAALTPTLLPRTAFVQGGLAALSALITYGVAGLILRFIRVIDQQQSFRIRVAKARPIVIRIEIVLSVVALILGPIYWHLSDNAQRRGVSMSPLTIRSSLNMVLISVAIMAILLFVSRVVTTAFGRIHLWLWKPLGPVFSRIAMIVLVVIVIAVSFDQLIVKGVYGSTNNSYRIGNATTDSGVYQPTSPLDSGGPGSLTPWKSLGLQGRNFAGGAVPTNQLQKFAGPNATVRQPIRVYAGLDTAATAQARAEICVKELIRTGAFHRKILVIASATGTGWVDPDAAAAIEFMYHGDSAIVSMQYSYLPSWIAFITEQSSAEQAARALITAVSSYWHTLPAAQRPKLVLFGESLGSLGAERALAQSNASTSVANVFAHVQAALFTGPVNGNPIWGQLTKSRVKGSPVWRPVVSNSKIRFANTEAQLETQTPDSIQGIQYVEHGTDPVTWFNFKTLIVPPAWITGPPGPGIVRGVMWFPGITWLQTAADLMAGFSAPVGYGHNYANAFAGGFASIAAPPMWSQADTHRLAATLAAFDASQGSSGS
jgi:uncharacterized membrane protein